jgi:hypothetical protein
MLNNGAGANAEAAFSQTMADALCAQCVPAPLASAWPRRSQNPRNAAVDFLEKLRPGGPWVLTAIVPDGGTTTMTAKNAEDVKAFVRQHDGKRNLYYSVNPTRTALSKKAAKIDIAAIEYALADLDPADGETPEQAKARYLAQLTGEFEPKATALVDSGNGIQGLWRLQKRIALGEPVNGKFSAEDQAKIDDVEARVAAVMVRLGAKAGTQNIDRILRLPGTTNLPNEKKRKAGRAPCPTRLIYFNGIAHPIEAFPLPATDGAGIDRSCGVRTLDTEDIAPNDPRLGGLDPRWIALGHEATGIAENYSGDRSRAAMAFACACLRAGIAEGVVASCVMKWKIGEHVREQANVERALNRLLKKARQFTQCDPVITQINAEYALAIVGGRAVIMRLPRNATATVEFINTSAFELLFSNDLIRVGEKFTPKGKHWLKHRQRRTYKDGVEFAPARDLPPTQYNLWRGFAVEPKPGDCSKFLAHLKDNVCRGDDELYLWVVGWFAQMFQQPGEKTGTSVVLRGTRGVGKTKVAEVIGSLFGHAHYSSVSEPRYVTGRFNSHMATCILLCADEAFWAGDKTAEGKLKDLITGLWHYIEWKGKEPVRVRNHIRLLVLGNEEWQVPAGFDERRFAVLDVGTDHIQDHPYFNAIDEEMNNGGREALLHYLLNFDLSQVNLRKIPRTEALLEQQIASFSTEEEWWFDILNRGELPGLVDENAQSIVVRKSELLKFMKETALPDLVSEKELSEFVYRQSLFVNKNGQLEDKKEVAKLGQCPRDDLFESYVRRAQKVGRSRRATETKLGMFLAKMVPGLKTERISGENGGQLRYYVFPPLKDCRKQFASKVRNTISWDDPEAKWERERGEVPF